MPLVRSAIRRAGRKGRGFDTPCGGMAEDRPQRVAMQGRRDGRHALFNGLLALWNSTARSSNPARMSGESVSTPRSRSSFMDARRLGMVLIVNLATSRFLVTSLQRRGADTVAPGTTHLANIRPRNRSIEKMQRPTATSAWHLRIWANLATPSPHMSWR